MYAGGNTLMKEGRIHTKTVLNMRGQPVVCPVRFIAFHPVADSAARGLVSLVFLQQKQAVEEEVLRGVA